jgi:glycosyltransferase involved in cell wall biosynthesis
VNHSRDNSERKLCETKAASRPLRVMLVSEPGIDGVFRYVESLTRYLLSQGVHTDLAYSSVRGSNDLCDLIKVVEEYGGKTLDLRTGRRPQLRDFAAWAVLLRFTKERRPDVIHAHSSKAGALVRAMRFRGVKVPMFYTPHAYFGMSRKKSPLIALFDGIEASLCRVGKTINVSKAEAEYARVTLRIPPERQLINPNGVDCKKFCPATNETRLRIRETLGLPQDSLVLGTVARYSYQKDPQTLHRAIRPALQRHSNLWFVHVGNGKPLWDKVDALGLHTRILRLRSLQPIDSFYKALDGFVLASRYEGFSLAVLEALATNLPLILTQVPGNLDLEATGLSHVYWTPPCNSSALADAIDRWASSYPHFPNHRSITCALFREDISYDRLLKEYELAAVRSAQGHGPRTRSK